jgi:hypothetical protein
MALLLKDPLAALDYAVDWGAEYLSGDSVAQSDWDVTPVEAGGVEIAGCACDGAIATVTATGGVAGHVYQLTNHVALESGRASKPARKRPSLPGW